MKLFLTFLKIVFLLCLLFGMTNQNIHAQTIIQTIPLPNTTYWNQTYGIAGDTTALYIASGTSTTTVYNYGRIYKLDFNGNIIDSLNSTTVTLGQSQGLAYDGTNIYYVRRYTSSCTIIKINENGVIIDSLRFGSSRYIGGAAWDGTHLWVSMYSPNPGRLIKIDWTTKTLVDSIWTIGDQPTGVAWDGQYIYYAMDIFSSEPNKNLIYVVDPGSGDTVRTILMPEPPTTDSNPRELCYDGNYLWLIARPVGGGTGQVLYKYDLKGGGTPAINVPIKFYYFGYVGISDSAVMVSTIQSIGTADLKIDSVKLIFSANYSTDLNPPISIPSGNSINFNIKFKPTFFGDDSAHIIIYHNDITRPPQTIRIAGKGMFITPVISVPSSFNYGNRRVNSTSSWKMKVENQGAGLLIINSASFNTPDFYMDSGVFPDTIQATSSKLYRVWFYPKSTGTVYDTLTLNNNSTNSPQAKCTLIGTGDATQLALGIPFWNYTVPKHPNSSTVGLVKAVRAIGDITGDGKTDVIVSSENYFTMALSGNSSVDNDSIWAFSTYVSNYSAGSIGTTGDYSHQKALAIASDLNNDGFNDVVIGTGGGNERVYAINGKTGHMLWTFGTDHPDSFGLGDFTGVDVSYDFNNDGIPDILAAAAATQSGGLGGRRSLYLFNGANGNLIWQSPLPGFTHGVVAIKDIDNDSIPDAIGTVGESAYKASAFSGATGSIIWDFSLTSSSGGGKEVMVLPISPTQDDIILGAFWGPVYRIDPRTGFQVWSTSTGNKGVMQFARLKDIDKDGIDEIVVATLGGGTLCLKGADGNILWSLPTGNTMGVAVIPDLNGDGFDDVIIASQPQGLLVVKGNDGNTLATYSFGANQTREVSILPDLDGNNSFEIIAGSNKQEVVLLSGGLDAPVWINSETELPTKYIVYQNYPNPFNPFTTIRYQIPENSHVTIKVYDILGQDVITLIDEIQEVGYKSIGWNGLNKFGQPVSSGTYFYKINIKQLGNSSNLFFDIKKMLLIR